MNPSRGNRRGYAFRTIERNTVTKQVTNQVNDVLEAFYAKVMLATSESISKGSSQAGECAADLRGMSLARAAGWNPVALDSVLARLKATKGYYGGDSYCDLRAQQATEVGTLLPPSTADAPAVAANWKTLDGYLKK